MVLRKYKSGMNYKLQHVLNPEIRKQCSKYTYSSLINSLHTLRVGEYAGWDKCRDTSMAVALSFSPVKVIIVIPYSLSTL